MTKRKHKPTTGSVSHGTMRDEDLIPCFLDTIHYIDPSRITKLRKNRDWKIITNTLKRYNTLPGYEFDTEQQAINHRINTLKMAYGYFGDYTAELFDILNELAPPYCSFGASEGDGADYGFWPDVESAKEGCEFVSGNWGHAPGDKDYPKKGFRGEWLHISDHGNATLYYRNSKGKDKEIWSVV